MFINVKPSLRWRHAGLLLGVLTLSSVAEAQVPPSPADAKAPSVAPSVPGAIVPAPSPLGEQTGKLMQNAAGSGRSPASSLNGSGSIGQSVADGRVIEDRAAILDERLNKSSRRAINSICRGC